MPLAKPPESPTFYMTCEKRERIIQSIESNQIPVMQNVMLYNNSNGLSNFKPYETKYVLDSGGYSAMNEFGGDFPWSVKEYHRWLQEAYKSRPFEWAAVMDLACETDFDDVMSVKERQDRTFENTVRHLELELDYPLLPVLQGRTIDQWISYYDRLADHGIKPEYVGVGTLCRKSSSKDIAAIEKALRARTKIEAIHGFGVKIAAFKHGAVFESADSQAWSWQTRFGNKLVQTSTDPPEYETRGYNDSAIAHKESFEAYYPRAKYLQEKAYKSRQDSGRVTALSDYV